MHLYPCLVVLLSHWSPHLQSGVQGAFASPISTAEGSAADLKGTSTGSANRPASQLAFAAAHQDSPANLALCDGTNKATSSDPAAHTASVTDHAHERLQQKGAASSDRAYNLSTLASRSSGTSFAANQSHVATDGVVGASVPTSQSSPSQEPFAEPQPFGSPSAIPLLLQPEQATPTGRHAAASPDQAAAPTNSWSSLWTEPLESPDQATAPGPLPEPDSSSDLLPSASQHEEASSLWADQAGASTDPIDRLRVAPLDDTVLATGLSHQQQQPADMPDEEISALLQHSPQPADLPDQAVDESPCVSPFATQLPDQDAVSVSSLSVEVSEVANQAAVEPGSVQGMVSDLPAEATSCTDALCQEPSGEPDQAMTATASLTQQSSELPFQADPSGTGMGSLPDQATTPELISSVSGQATTPCLNRGLLDQAMTPELKTRLPGLATLPHIPQQGSARGVSATPKTGGARDFGSWWTPKGLTPAWMKMKTPAWVKKMRQPDMVCK